MTFNDNSSFDSGNVTRRGPGGGAIAGGGGVLMLLLGFLSMQFLGVDITQMFAPADQGAQSGEDFSCTGAEANASIDCRMEGAAVTLEQFWAAEAPNLGISSYHDPSVVLYDNSTSSGCGTASNAVGPFYCPGDEGIYIDTAFFQILTDKFGAEGGPLAEMYVLAHEWGHHVQTLEGTMNHIDQQSSGPGSDLVRLELQADCYAGAWMAGASTATDANGNPIMQPPTREELLTVVSAAQSIGDDHIMEQSGMQVQPERFTHGSSEQRTNWLAHGYQHGVTSCTTFDVPANQL